MAEASEQASMAPGLVIAETYELSRMIGQGGMGAVWEARHLRLPGKKVAIKVLLASAEPGSELASRFRREAEIAARLAHPAIVQVLDFNVLPSGQPYLVMELLAGESLARRLNRGPIPLAETLALVRQIGGALQTAHRAGVVHRDLKPDNIFLVPSEDEGPPRVKVLDFGISKMLGSTSLHTQEQRVMGTPQYMAPEQAKGQNSAIDGRTDLFALGAIVYEMLGARPPFTGETLAELVFKVVYEPHEPLARRVGNLPATVTDAVDRALAKDPVARFADASAFVTALTGRPLPQTDPGGELRRSAEATAATISSQDGVAPAMAASPADPPFALTAPLAPTGAAAERSAVIARQPPDRLGHTRADEPDSSQRLAADAPPARSRVPLILAAVLVVGAGLGLVLWQRGEQHAGAKAPPPAVVAVLDGGPSPVVVIDAAPPVIDAAPGDARQIAVAAPHDRARQPAPDDDDDRLPGDDPAVTDLLRQAVKAGPDDALRLARRALAGSPSPRQTNQVRIIMTRAFCAKGDLGQASPSFKKVKAGSRKVRLRRFCAEHEVIL
jgi:serine/threonine-protein kinase